MLLIYASSSSLCRTKTPKNGMEMYERQHIKAPVAWSSMSTSLLCLIFLDLVLLSHVVVRDARYLHHRPTTSPP